ncbi:MAG: biopolymer transporter ExbD [Planctomycetota bacterium]
MAKSRKKAAVSEGAEVDMTPMIDVTFQLIIFFMVVTQITTQDNVSLRLPDALAANDEDPNAKKIFTVHIAPVNQGASEDMPDEFGWFCYGEPTPRGADEMKGILESVASTVNPEIEYPGRGPDGISENMLLVRCDARCPAGEFGKLIELMVEARMYKIKIAIMKDQKVE